VSTDIARANGVGSIPELEEGTDKIYNTATVYDPEGMSIAQGRG
jgi:hypothetical protein